MILSISVFPSRHAENCFKDEVFLLLLGFYPFTLLPEFFADWIHCRPFTPWNFPGELAASLLPPPHAGGVCLECGQLPWLLFWALSLQLCAFFWAVELASPYFWFVCIFPWKLDSVSRAGASCLALWKECSNSHSTQLTLPWEGQGGKADSARLWLGGRMEKSFQEKEISDFGSRSRNMYFRKRSDIIKSTPLSLCGTDSHFPDELCQVFHKSRCHLDFVRVVAPKSSSASSRAEIFLQESWICNSHFFL